MACLGHRPSRTILINQCIYYNHLILQNSLSLPMHHCTSLVGWQLCFAIRWIWGDNLITVACAYWSVKVVMCSCVFPIASPEIYFTAIISIHRFIKNKILNPVCTEHLFYELLYCLYYLFYCLYICFNFESGFTKSTNFIVQLKSYIPVSRQKVIFALI